METIKYFKKYNAANIKDDDIYITSIHVPVGSLITFYMPYDARRPSGNKGWLEGFVAEDHLWHMRILVKGNGGLFFLTINKRDLFTGDVIIKGYDFTVYLDRKKYKVD